MLETGVIVVIITGFQLKQEKNTYLQFSLFYLPNCFGQKGANKRLLISPLFQFKPSVYPPSKCHSQVQYLPFQYQGWLP